MSIPLLLKIKPGADSPQFTKLENIVDFQNRLYKFAAIYNDEIPQISLDRLLGQTCVLVLVGPTGSGKTTTLQNLVSHQLQKNHPTQFTACEVSENRHFVDMVNNGQQKRYVSSMPLEKQLRKIELTETSMEKLFADRKTMSTASNTQSSRLCLIVTLYYGKLAVTIVDMMGNEKYEPARQNLNVFANSNMSFITQMLLTKTTRVRSSNLVANLIFQKLALNKMKVILHLDECGNPELIKSSLYNIVDVVRDFRVGPESCVKQGSTSNFVPNYARPTVLSLSPRKNAGKLLRLPRSKLEILTPTKNKLRPLNNMTDASLSRRRPNRMTENLYEIELKSLRESNAQLLVANDELNDQARMVKEHFVGSITELKENVHSIRQEELLILQEKLVSIRSGYADLEKVNSTLTEKCEFELSQKKKLEQSQTEFQSIIQKLEEEKDASAAQLGEVNKLVEALSKELTEKKADLDRNEAKLMELREKHEGELQKLHEQTKGLEISLKESQLKVDTLSRQIEALSADKSSLELELSKIKEQLQQSHTKLSASQLLIDESDKLLNAEKKQTMAQESQLSEMSSKIESLNNSWGETKTKLERLESERKELSKTNADLVLQNQTLEQKYSAELKEKETGNADEQTELKKSIKELKESYKQSEETIKELQQLSAQQEKEIVSLKEQLENLQMEATELAKYKSKCDNLESKAIELRDESIAQTSIQEMMISNLQEEVDRLKEVEASNKELKKQLKQFRTPSPQKSFNPSTDIFEDPTRDYLKAFKQSMRATPSPKGILRENNLMSSEKKKLKRKHSGNFMKSPKMAARMS